MAENMIVLRDLQIFRFNLDWSNDDDDKNLY